MQDIEQASAALFAMTGKIGQYLRENDWLMSIKQRTGIPGGACEFDLPSYHYWLHRPSEERTGQLAAWTGPLPAARRHRDHPQNPARVGQTAARQGRAGHVPADAGGKTAQMMRVRDRARPAVRPEISANKYVLNIRFLAQNGAPSGAGGSPVGPEPKIRTADWDVDFELTFCNL